MIRPPLRPVVLLIALHPLCVAYGATLHSLGIVDTDIRNTYGLTSARPAVSGDGSTVAASSGQAAFTWTRDGGKTPLPSLRPSYATALSYDGSVVVGQSVEPDGYWWPTRWTPSGRQIMWLLSDYHATPTDVSADGNVVVGFQILAGGAFKWIEHAAWDIGTVSKGMGVSGDGALLLANKYGTRPAGWPDWLDPAATYACSAYLWQDWNLTDLGSVAGVEGTTYASAISADGRVVTGWCYTPSLFWQAFRWTTDGGMVGLGAAPGWSDVSDATWMRAASGDGSVLVGLAVEGVGRPGSGGFGREQRAIIWDARHGIRFLSDVLEGDHGLDLTGWHLDEATGISDDGRTIVGYGRGPLGISEGWVVTIPEPAMLCLLGPAALLLGRRNRAPC